MFLKLQNKTLLEFDMEKGYYKVYEPDLLPFCIRNRIEDNSLKSGDSDYFKIAYKNSIEMNTFFSGRVLSVNRENAKYILNQLNISQKSDIDTHIKIMKLCKGLSIADDYWIAESDAEKWEDVNLRTNPLHETIRQIALFGKSLSITGKIRTAELTGLGAYAKAWQRIDGKLYLHKAGTLNGSEPQRETLMSDIIDCFNIPQVKYKLGTIEDKVVTQCENMTSDKYSTIPAGDVMRWCSKVNLDFDTFIRELDSETFYKTVVIDYLCANRDRHDGNWGIYMDNNTGKPVCLHPLYDHNNAFDKDFLKDPTGGICQLIPGKTMKEAAQYAITRCDFRCVKPVTKDMFFDKEYYKVFMERASELGLYKRNNVSLLKKVFFIHEDYIPVTIKNNNINEYWDKLNKSDE